MCTRQNDSGYTLSELLVALAILGLIATFTIPKLLLVQDETKYRAIAQETANMISGAYDAYRIRNVPSSSTYATDLTAYMNYVKTFTSDPSYDDWSGGPSHCAVGVRTCLVLHNGAMVRTDNASVFQGTTSTNALFFGVDPDGVEDGKRREILFLLYYDGKITSLQYCRTGTLLGGIAFGCNPSSYSDPSWFRWN